MNGEDVPRFFCCQGCRDKTLEVAICNVRTMHFAPFKKLCPREAELTMQPKKVQK